MEALIKTHKKEHIFTITLNQPKAYNTLSLKTLQELESILDSLKNDSDSRVVILEGSGPGFSAGHNLKEIHQNPDPTFYQTLIETCSRVMLKIHQIPQPVIAKVHGYATAAGCQLVASCDLAIAEEGAKFATPGVLIGLFCSTPMVPLSRTIHRKHAMEMLLTGDPIDANQALKWGLINRLTQKENLDQTTWELAKKISDKSTASISIGKSTFYQQLEQPIAQAYEMASQAMVENLLKEDASEGILAFLEKRKPCWKNK